MIVPAYYEEFQCVADACRHNCCIGWKIDIDEETAARYQKIPGELGDRLRRQIAGDPPHFILDDEGRCPCLTGENLCALLLTQGQDYLCQICRDHPRFRNFWPDRVEMGLGACCEEAARLMLSQRTPLVLIHNGMDCGKAAEPPVLTEEQRRERNWADLLYQLRDRLFSAVYQDDRSLDEMEREVLRLADTTIPNRTAEEWALFYLDLERLDETWTDVLHIVLTYGKTADRSAFERRMMERKAEYQNMLAYFLYRHVPEALEDGDLAGKVAFAVLSCRFLRLAGAAWYEKYDGFSVCDQTELFRMYSAEIEYSQDNMDAVYDMLWKTFENSEEQ